MQNSAEEKNFPAKKNPNQSKQNFNNAVIIHDPRCLIVGLSNKYPPKGTIVIIPCAAESKLSAHSPIRPCLLFLLQVGELNFNSFTYICIFGMLFSSAMPLLQI